MQKKYEPGMFCSSIHCERHAPPGKPQRRRVSEEKSSTLQGLLVWKFLIWTKDKGWRKVMTMPEISSRELAACIKGIDIVPMEDLSEDNILTL
jgi:hypothetical protein